MPTEKELRAQLHTYSQVLNARVGQANVLDDYYDGAHPYPPLVQESQVKRAYKMLMELSPLNLPQAIVDSTEASLEIQGFRFGDKGADDEVWELFQENGLDAESGMLHQSVLTTGRAYAIVWGDGSRDPQPRVTLEHTSTCMVEYEPGSRRLRGALRRWQDGKTWYANLFRPDGLYKFQTEAEELPDQAEGWKRRDVEGETWPLDNPFGRVNVVEFAINRTLRPNRYGTAWGDFARNLPHLKRIDYKIFSGLVALTWSGFPLRYVIGDPIMYDKNEDGTDDKSSPKPPFDALASAVAQFENPNAKVGQLNEANVSNYSAEDDIKHLAAVTATPLFHLLPGAMINIAEPAVRAGQDAHVAKVRRYHRPLGEAWEDVTRLMLQVKNPQDPRAKDASAEIIWRDPEHRSLAEQADAATKLASIDVPLQVIMSKVLGMTPREISRAQAEAAADAVLSQLPQIGENGQPEGEPVGVGAGA